MAKPRRLYHESRPRRRRSIAEHGLDPDYGRARRGGAGTRAVFLTDTRADCTPFGDVWAVDTRGLDVEQHPGEDSWWLAYAVIPASQLRLVQAGD